MNTKFTLDKKDYRIEEDGTVVYRIRALNGFHSQIGYIPAGAYGGYVEKEANLSKLRTCWIDKDSVVKGDALIASEAMVIGSTVDGKATVGDKACVVNSYISDYAVVTGRAVVLGSMVTRDAVISGMTRLYKSHVCGDACVFEKKCLDNVVVDNCVGSFYNSEKDSRALCTHKYTLIPLGRELSGLYRLRANIDIDNFCASIGEYRYIQSGTLGGIVSGVHNLSRFGQCWIDYDAMVIGDASVHDYAFVTGHSVVHGNAVVCGGALVDDCELKQNAYVAGKAMIKGLTIGGKARVFGAAECSQEDVSITPDNSHNVQKKDFGLKQEQEFCDDEQKYAEQYR